MAKKQNNNGLIVGIVIACVAVVAIIIGVVFANRKSDDGGESSENNTSEVDYSTVDETVTFGDYEGMEKLSKAIQNGEMVGKKVKIDGLVMHPTSTYSIVQENEAGTQKIGTQFIIEGADEDSYPQDGDHVVITGEIIEKSPMYFVISTTPKYVEVKE